MEGADAKVRISEVVPHSDVEDGYYDYAELHNTGEKPVDISGHFLSDKGSEKMRCRIKNGTILQPGDHKSFSFQGPGDVVLLVADCPFRLSKLNDRVYYGKLTNGVYELLDDANIAATINRVSNQRWKTSDDKVEYLQAFPTENFDERYPIVGPFIISKIVWDPPAGKQQYIQITNIFGKGSLNGPSQLTSRGGYTYQIRFEEHKDLYNDADQLLPSAIVLPTSITLQTNQSMYVVSGNANAFAADMGVPSNLVVGPWSGKIRNATSGNVWVGFYGQEHGGLWLAELVRWKPEGKDGWRPMANGGIERVSKNSVASEPDNWIGIGGKLFCNLSAPYPASDCPHMDDCTAYFCENQGGVGVCTYSALVCNHPNWNTCYPDYICRLPAPARYNAGCKLTSSVFGHTTGDTAAWGFYGPVGNEIKWYQAGCTNRSIDCDVNGWEKWSKCASCQDNQNRTREVKQYPNAGGLPCPPLFESRACNHDGKCKPCDYLKCTAPQICWPDNVTFTAMCVTPTNCEISEVKMTECTKSCGTGTLMKYQNITKEATYGGNCTLPPPVTEDCNTQPCPIDCSWSDWTGFSECTTSCGNGQRDRTRNITIPAQFGGTCPGRDIETEACNTFPCPIDCVWGLFAEWNTCSVTCGGGKQYRSRDITTQAQFGGINCTGATDEEQDCGTDPCPIDCVGNWTEWDECDCEWFNQSRSFLVTVEMQFGGIPCEFLHQEEDVQDCETDPCPVEDAGLKGWQIALIVLGALLGAIFAAAAAYGAFIASSSAGVPAADYI